MEDRFERRFAAGCAIVGSVALFLGTYLHPMDADPHDAVAAFAEYAADRLWVTSHLTQFAGVVLMVAALLIIAKRLEHTESNTWARLGSAGAVAGMALAAALQAVDGVALKVMVDAWAAAPTGEKAMVFQGAFAVRQIETGLAAMFALLMGCAVTLYGVALWHAWWFPRWLAVLAIVGGVSTAAGGIAIAYTGFSSLAMSINMPANSMLLLWMLGVGGVLSREQRSVSRGGA